MKKQDILTPIGLLLGISLIIFAISSGEVGLGGFYDVMSIIITIGGSFSALLITFPLDEMINILKMTKSLFTTPAVSKVEMIDTFKNLSMKSRKNGDIVDIEATIVCERDSHKRIIIGKQGAMIKEIGSKARYDMERLLGSKVTVNSYLKIMDLMIKIFSNRKF